MAQLAGCSTPTKTMNLLTPDRFGFGKVEGTLDLVGTSNGSYYGEWWGDPAGGHGGEYGNSYQDVNLDGTSEATMMWLEWDFPQWKEPDNYDRYLRERVRTLNLEKDLLIAERELKKRDDAIDKTIERIDNALECTPPERESEGMWPKKLTEQ